MFMMITCSSITIINSIMLSMLVSIAKPYFDLSEPKALQFVLLKVRVSSVMGHFETFWTSRNSFHFSKR